MTFSFTLSHTWLLALIVAGGVVLMALALLLFRLGIALIWRRRAGGFSSDLVKDIGRKFESGIDTFKENDKGLYTLPWYILVGEPGAGKTEAIRHSNIGFPQGLNKPAQGRGGTVNMDWWFARKAILLDTAGRLMFEATEEWRSFLKLLKRHRPLSPINGMILAIPAPSLLTDDADRIAEKAGQIAQQFEAVQRELGVRFPVYVLITKADLITGFREYFHNLSDPVAQNQMLGWSNPASLDEPFRPERVEQHLQSVRERLKRRQLGLLLDPAQVQENSPHRLDQVDALYAFPNELMRISSRLRTYLETIFMPNPWSAKPLFLRGIYFTSAMTEGAALDLDLAETFGIPPAELPGELRVFSQDKSYFLRDFFLDKCFPEGGLVTTATNVAQSQRQRKVSVLAVGAIAAMALIGASVYGQYALRQSVGRHADFWSAVANREAKQAKIPNTDRAGWFCLIDPATGEYRGGEKLSAPFPSMMSIADLHEWAAALAPVDVKVPWMFKPWDLAAGSGLNRLRREACRDFFEQGVFRPLVSAAMTKIGASHWDSSGKMAEAIGELVRLSTGENAARLAKPFNPDPLYRFVLGDEAYAQLSTAAPEDRSFNTMESLYAAYDVPWPPVIAETADVARAATMKLNDVANAVATDVDSLANVVTTLAVYREREKALLELTPVCREGLSGTQADYNHLTAQWREKLETLTVADDELRAALKKTALTTGAQQTTGVLSRQFADLQKRRQGVRDALASLNVTPGTADLHMARAFKSLHSALAFFELNGSKEANTLARLDADYLSDGAWKNRLAAYSFRLIHDLQTSPGHSSDDWRAFKQSVASIQSVPVGFQGSSDIDAEARTLLEAADEYAVAHRRGQVEDALLQHLPADADAWAAAVLARAKDGSGSSLPVELPLVHAPSEKVDLHYDPTAASEMAGDWVSFQSAWAARPAALEDAGRDRRIVAAQKGFEEYTGQYVKYWRSGAVEMTIPPLEWDAVTKQVRDANWPKTVAAGLGALHRISRDAVMQFTAKLPKNSSARAAIDPASSSDEADIGPNVLAIWQRIIGPAGDPIEARRQLLLLSSDDLKLLFAAPGADQSNLSERYWKAVSAQFLAALKEPAMKGRHQLIGQLQAELGSFPLAAWDENRPALTVDQVAALRKGLDQLWPTTSSGKDPAGEFAPGVRENFQAIRGGTGGASEAAAHRKLDALLPMVQKLLAPQPPAHVNVYLLPLDEQQALEEGSGKTDVPPAEWAKRFSKMQVVFDGPAGSEPQASVDLTTTVPTLLGQTDFPLAGAAVKLRLSGDGGPALEETGKLDGGPWWPLVALKKGSAQPETAGKKRSWRARIPIEESASGKKDAVWIGLEFDRDVDPAGLWAQEDKR